MRGDRRNKGGVRRAQSSPTPRTVAASWGRPEDAALEAYRIRNESLPDCLVFHLGRRGFFAEYNDLTRAMIYAWQNNLQLLLDSTRFPYRLEHGWNDFFEPFCRSADEVDAARVRERFEFNPQSPDRSGPGKLYRHRPHELQIGDLHLTRFDDIYGFLHRMIFRLNARRRREVAPLIDSLSLPDEYLAVHIRRGDKMGEDIHYPAALYLSRLGDIPFEGTVFVMSDDYAAVEELRRALAIQGVNARVATLCNRDDRGFDVNKLNKGETFMSGADSDPEPLDRRHLNEHTIRLLAEVIIATRAAKLISTQLSCLGMALKALSRAGNVTLLRPYEVREFTVAKLRPGRHILDAYKKVLLIRIGRFGTGFFTCVQYALNQIQYCEREGYLPVVHYNGDYGNYFHEPALGDDVWAYYFEPVAGYSKADIDAMLADDGDPLTPDDVVQLSDHEIMQLCHFDPRSIFHYTYGYWREHLPAKPYAWYRKMRRKGHRYFSEYLKIKPAILAEVDEFVDRHMREHTVLGVHIRATDMSYAPPVPLQHFLGEIDRRLEMGSDRVFLATDQQQYVERLRSRYGDRLIHRKCLRSTDARNPMILPRPSPAAQGREVLVDALLLSHSKFILKSPSAVSEFAHYFSPRLGSYDLGRYRTHFADWDYTKPDPVYHRYPKAWDLVGADDALPEDRPRRDSWVEPVVATERRTSVFQGRRSSGSK